MLWQHQFLNAGFQEPIQQHVFSHLSQREVLNLGQASKGQYLLVAEFKKSDQYKAMTIANTTSYDKCKQVLKLYDQRFEEYNRLKKLVINQETKEWNSSTNVWSKALWLLITDDVNTIQINQIDEVISQLSHLAQTPEVTSLINSLSKTALLLAYIDRIIDHDTLKNDMFALNQQNASYFNMQGIILEDVNFNALDLRFANFSYSDLDDVKFREANLNGAIFISVEGYSIDFNSSDLSGANFEESKLSLCDFDGASIDGACFNKANLSDSYGINHSELSGANDTTGGFKESLSDFDFRLIRGLPNDHEKTEDSDELIEEERHFKRLKR